MNKNNSKKNNSKKNNFKKNKTKKNKLLNSNNKIKTNKLKKNLIYNKSKGGFINLDNIKSKSMFKNNQYQFIKNQTYNDNDLFAKLTEDELVYKYYNKKDDDTVNKPSKIKRCMCINYNSINDFQTYDRCPRNVINNSEFCELHQDCKSYLRNFLSGYEPEYQPQLWADPYIEGSHNCYSYFLNRQIKAVKEKCNEICLKKHKTSCPKKDSECTDLKPQPGDFELIKRTGSDKDKERIYKCPNMFKKIMNDNPTLIPTNFNSKCPNNYYKGAYVVDPDNTYHFYRANKDGTWSHKPGISPISNVDSSKQNIYVPHFANRNYEEDDDNDEAINYTNFCGYYCIPTNNTIHKNLA